MSDQIIQIAQRMKALREISEETSASVAEALSVSEETYLKYENGELDVPASFLLNFANHFRVELTEVLTGTSARLHMYCLTRKDQGIQVERRKAYKYQHLAFNFQHKKAEPFHVTVDPQPEGAPVSLNEHPGQEFDYLLEGRLLLRIGEQELMLQPGDSLYYDSTVPHGMQAMDDKPAKFLAIIF